MMNGCDCAICTSPIPTAAPSTFSTAPTFTASPTSVLCSCGVTYRYGDAHSCVTNGAIYLSPANTAIPVTFGPVTAGATWSMSPAPDANIVQMLERVALAVEKLVRELAEEKFAR